MFLLSHIWQNLLGALQNELQLSHCFWYKVIFKQGFWISAFESVVFVGLWQAIRKKIDACWRRTMTAASFDLSPPNSFLFLKICGDGFGPAALLLSPRLTCATAAELLGFRKAAVVTWISLSPRPARPCSLSFFPLAEVFRMAEPLWFADEELPQMDRRGSALNGLINKWSRLYWCVFTFLSNHDTFFFTWKKIPWHVTDKRWQNKITIFHHIRVICCLYLYSVSVKLGHL